MRLIDPHTRIRQRKKRSRKKPKDVYISTMNSPASTIDSSIASAARTKNSTVGMKNMSRGLLVARVAVTLGVGTFLV